MSDSPVIIASSAGAVEATVGLVYQKEEEEKPHQAQNNDQGGTGAAQAT